MIATPVRFRGAPPTFVGASAIDSADVEFGRRVQPEEVRPPDVDAVQAVHARCGRLTAILVRIERLPQPRLFHFELGELAPMMG